MLPRSRNDLLHLIGADCDHCPPLCGMEPRLQRHQNIWRKCGDLQPFPESIQMRYCDKRFSVPDKTLVAVSAESIQSCLYFGTLDETLR